MISEEELIMLLAEERAVESADSSALNEASSALAAIFARSDNIHAHTANIGKTCRDLFLPMDDKYNLHVRTSASLEVTRAEILDYSGNDVKVKAILDRILASSGVEAETGLNIQDILIRVWSITKHNALAIDHKGLIIDALRHNIEAGGGCLAGISARLVAPYSLLINQILKNIHSFQQSGMLPAAPGLRSCFDEFQEALALALSRSEYESAAGGGGGGGASGGPGDSDFERAIAESLQDEDTDFLMAQRLSLRGDKGNTDPLEEEIAIYMSLGLNYDDAIAAIGTESDGAGSLPSRTRHGL